MQEGIYLYLPQIITMAPSIAIVLFYLGLTFCVSYFVHWNFLGGLLRMFIMVSLTILIFAISITIITITKSDFSQALIQSSYYNMNIHEEFMIALCVEMAGAIIFIPFIYGWGSHTRFLMESFVFSFIFLYIFFILPIDDWVRGSIELNQSIANNYIENFRVELLSLIVLFFFYALFRILKIQEGRMDQIIRLTQVVFIALCVSCFVWWNREIILKPEYENLSLAIGAGLLSVAILGIAKLNDKSLWFVIFLSAIASSILLIGTQIPDFQFDAPTSINVTAELIGAITVALILDTEIEV